MEKTPLKQKEFEKWNNEMAQKYNPDSFINESGWPIRWVERRRMEMAIGLLDCRSTDAVLDLGCGSGNLLTLLEGSEITGVDLSDYLLTLAKNRVQGRPNIKILRENAEQLPFGDNSFDRVVCSEVLEHVQNPDRVLKEIHRVSKPGARIVITFPNEKLINFCKKIVIFLRIKNLISGRYKMSDNMLDEWHLNEIPVQEMIKSTEFLFRLIQIKSAPHSLIPFHRLFAFENKDKART